jgi:hypothetical protein
MALRRITAVRLAQCRSTGKAVPDRATVHDVALAAFLKGQDRNEQRTDQVAA